MWALRNNVSLRRVAMQCPFCPGSPYLFPRGGPAAVGPNLVDVTLYMLLLAQCDMGVAFLE
jgi:hypothetical protein